MEAVKRIKGIVAPLEALNVDTDQIIPKQFLKRIERTGYKDALFFDWRFTDDGTKLNADFEMNAPRYRGAKVLLTKANFGCGSSREHAPWALKDYGFVAILAPSFADIFYNNCFNNGMLPIVLPDATINEMFRKVRAKEGYAVEIDVDAQTVTLPDGTSIHFDIDPFLKQRLLNGWDQIGLTLRHEDEITDYERKHGIG
jgi:3-isopropylmalate/(R)-2-methylmalate dehydratase small subunit